MAADAVLIGRMDPNDKLGNDLHTAAKLGNRKKLKKILATGISADYPNSLGQTALFCACYENQEGAVDILLSYGANPNEKSNSGATPVHVTALSGNLDILLKLLSHNGDLRLHDKEGRTTKDWALMQPNPKKRLRMIEFLEKTRLFALTRSGHDFRDTMHNEHGNSRVKARIRNNPVVRMFNERIRGQSSVNLDDLKSSASLGYGKVYLDHDASGGFISTIPLISDNVLIHDADGTTYDNGPNIVMQSMLWKHTKVTAKRLHRDVESGTEVDLLIKEADYMGKLRHPNLLLLMGICQTNNLDGIVLVFESVAFGSLYYHLHQKVEKMHSNQILDVCRQICNALLFLHEHNLIHCFVTSHAISIINQHQAKLGNFEYMMEVDRCEMGKTSAVSSNHSDEVAYNWMAPEIMNENSPSFASDMYSYCCVLWEMIKCEIPWRKCSAEKIRKKVLHEEESLQLDYSRIPEKYHSILHHGLQRDPMHRVLDFCNVQQILQMADQEIGKYLKMIYQKQKVNELQKKSNRKKHKQARYPQETASSDSVDETVVHKEMTEYDEFNNKPNGKRKAKWSKTAHGKQDNCNQNGYKYGHDHNMRFVDEMNFTHKNVSWKLQEEQEGDKYYYTVGVKGSPQPRSPQKTHNGYQKQISDSESELQSDSQLKQEVEHHEVQSLARKYSYLKAQENCSPPKGHCMVKPASHCTAGNIDKPIEKQLTTAGSIYALYNSHYGEEECKSPRAANIEDNKRNPYSTMPRKRKRMGATPDMRPREEYCPGRGSVRNLVELFQTQQNEHSFQQAVLCGRAKEFKESSQLKSPVHPRKIDFYNTEEKEKNTKSPSPFKKAGSIPSAPPLYPNIEDTVTACSSLTTVSSSASQENNVKESSSVESALLDRWVSRSLQKCQNSLTDEIFNELANKAEDELKEESGKTKKHHKKKKNKSAKNNKRNEKCDIEEFYFDDDLRNKNIQEESHMRLQKPLLPGKLMQYDNNIRSSFHDIPSKLNEPDPLERNNRMMELQGSPPGPCPRYVPATSLLQYEKIKKDCEKRGAFQSTVMIQSSSRDPDSHVVTHTLTDLVDGTTSTLYGKTLQASKVVTTHYTQ
ncbi:probable serine/threonine-protein kinase roco7 isoform X1 [Saccostrea cucullata]|uniref:probable serine/threonine-protein kinase roco7 isoform X1 n=1 Tax=Saccostrea cuccullata TaxID=36930 RepID=UPI002ED015B6